MQKNAVKYPFMLRILHFMLIRSIAAYNFHGNCISLQAFYLVLEHTAICNRMFVKECH